jgi:hypothetical protein
MHGKTHPVSVGSRYLSGLSPIHERFLINHFQLSSEMYLSGGIWSESQNSIHSKSRICPLKAITGVDNIRQFETCFKLLSFVSRSSWIIFGITLRSDICLKPKERLDHSEEDRSKHSLSTTSEQIDTTLLTELTMTWGCWLTRNWIAKFAIQEWICPWSTYWLFITRFSFFFSELNAFFVPVKLLNENMRYMPLKVWQRDISWYDNL